MRNAHYYGTHIKCPQTGRSSNHLWPGCFDTDQGQIHVEVTVQPETEAELAMPQAAMIKEAKRKLRLGNKLPTEVISMTVHDMLMSRVA